MCKVIYYNFIWDINESTVHYNETYLSNWLKMKFVSVFRTKYT